MGQVMIDVAQSVQFIRPLRAALMDTSKKKRKSTFNGLVTALKALHLVGRKEDVKGLFEGIDHNGDHWFMAEIAGHRPEVGEDMENLHNYAVGQLKAHEEGSSSWLYWRGIALACECLIPSSNQTAISWANKVAEKYLKCPPTNQLTGSKD